ncbi:MAG: hypothetical protein ACLRZ7_11610 [Lachnospiraceae bacterium]
MAFLSEFLIETVRFILLVAIAVGGVYAGKKLREVKDKKNMEA